jgi:uncharacterized protein YqeY
MVRAAVKNAEIDLHREATDAEVQDLIAREMKRRTEAVEMFRHANRMDLVTQEESELVILKSYLPEQLSASDVEAVVRKVVAELGATGPAQMGPVMREAMARLKGQADGRAVNEIVRRVLSE